MPGDFKTDAMFAPIGSLLRGVPFKLGKVSGTENDSAIFVVISLKVLD